MGGRLEEKSCEAAVVGNGGGDAPEEDGGGGEGLLPRRQAATMGLGGNVEVSPSQRKSEHWENTTTHMWCKIMWYG